jgi:hypothetical protein
MGAHGQSGEHRRATRGASQILVRAMDADLIIRTLTEVGSPALTVEDLEEHTGLSSAAVQNQVKWLCRAGNVATSEDGHGTLWVRLCDT